jgi:lysyl-tRNA synthetase class 1
MLWFADLAAQVAQDTPHIINDSKTPSGKVHVGALRGVVMHDAVFRALAARGKPVKYIFGVDDYDPMDDVPDPLKDPVLHAHLEQFRGMPLCNIPAPPGSKASDLAHHFIDEFFDIFRELGVEAEIYYMRDHYRSGRFNEAIDAILRKADVVRRVYKEVSGAVRPETWLPFQVVCEKCGRVGTTEVNAYDGKEVEYVCRPNLVKWAKGCEHRGKVSPFDGKGKLPWKLEWVAKWKVLGITIEGAGKDHTTKGGSRDVAGACVREIFGQEPPVNIPYEFFLVDGKKMSSSRGVGATARAMADFLPPELVRFLILRTLPSRPVDFGTDQEWMVKLFNELDRLHKRSSDDPTMRDDERELYRLCEIPGHGQAGEGGFFDASFQLLLTFVQMPHVNLLAEIEKRKGAPLTEVERKHFDRRVHAAKWYLEHLAREDEKIHLQDALPARAEELGPVQRAFLHGLADALEHTAWEDDAVQARLFDLARRTPIDQGTAFKALYRVLLDRELGPRAGALMACLDKAWIVARLRAVSFSEAAFLRESATSDVGAWLDKNKAQLAGGLVITERAATDDAMVRALEITATLKDGKVHILRAPLDARADVEKAAKDRDVAV